MSSHIFDTLNDLIQQSQLNTKVIDRVNGEVIKTEPNIRYYLSNVYNSTVHLNRCKQLKLLNCRNVKIVSDKLPIMGLHLLRTDNTTMNIRSTPPKSGEGYISLDSSVKGKFELEQECTIEVNACSQIIVNDTNISDQFFDSTWKMSPAEND
jgi:hypothetical protein